VDGHSQHLIVSLPPQSSLSTPIPVDEWQYNTSGDTPPEMEIEYPTDEDRDVDTDPENPHYYLMASDFLQSQVVPGLPLLTVPPPPQDAGGTALQEGNSVTRPVLPSISNRFNPSMDQL